MPHESGVTFVSACNCGRRQGNRDDPFSIMEANFKFFAQMEEDCCQDLDHIKVPVFQNDTNFRYDEKINTINQSN